MDKLISLDENVIKALQFFIKNKPVELNLGDLNLPFVIGSGNAFNCGKIIFSDRAAVFCDESNFRETLHSFGPVIKKKLITQALVISASGEKDSVWEVELAKNSGLSTILMTCKPESGAAKIADKVYSYKSIAEPYTYNVSTYLGMILSATHENPQEILDFIEKIKLPQNFSSYKSYSFILPDKYINITPMLDIKKSELFGSTLSLRAFTFGHARHAKFVIRTNDELVITVGAKNDYFGYPSCRWDLQIPQYFNYAGVLALTYFLTGKIQEVKPDVYRSHIQAYCSDYGPKAYGNDKPFEIIVPGAN